MNKTTDKISGKMDDCGATVPAAVAEWLADKQRLLVVSHERPDGDAFGSVFGTVKLLLDAGKVCHGYMQRAVPRRYQAFLPRMPMIAVDQDHFDARTYDGVICLDTTDVDRLALPPGSDTALLSAASVCNIDHHPDNAGYGDTVWVAPDMGATAQMMSMLGRHYFSLDIPTAVCFFAGMLTDTGGLRFANTTAALLRECAILLEMGVDYGRIADALFFQEDYGRKKLEADVLANAQRAHNGRLIYSVLRPEDLESYGVKPEDTEGLVDCLRTIRNVHVACLLQPCEGVVRFSLRARSMATPVNKLARQLNGGGHPLAAGARVEGITLRQAENKLIELTKDLLNL